MLPHKRGLIVKEKFDAAHYLYDYEGKCANIHGHTWEVVFYFQERTVRDAALSHAPDMIVDFGKLKEIIRRILPDHKFLNKDTMSFAEKGARISPTAERLCEWIYECFNDEMVAAGGWRIHTVVDLTRIEVWESERCGAFLDFR